MVALKRETALLFVGILASITLFTLIIWDAFNPAYDLPTQTIYLLLLMISVFIGVDLVRGDGGPGGPGNGPGNN
jgi:hypothetical protein